LKVSNNGISKEFKFDIIINCGYSNINSINQSLNAPKLDLTYELSEMIKIKLPEKFKNLGVTIMDGDFMSIMPYGLTEFHTIWHVRRSPHEISKSGNPKFSCNSRPEVFCSKDHLEICLNCPLRPMNAFDIAIESTKKFIPWIIKSEFVESLVTVKVIKSNVDSTDERPSVIYQFENINDYFVILSGKLDAAIELSNQLIHKLLYVNRLKINELLKNGRRVRIKGW
jgi:hypothetical protein